MTARDKILADLAVLCDGDMRRALNSLEVLVLGLPEGGDDHRSRTRGVRA